jgi:hypothetical protein
MNYELWAVGLDNRPEHVGTFDGIFRAALRLATVTACNDPERWTFWLNCPERVTGDNPEGIDAYDVTVIQAAKDLAQSRRRRRVYLANAGARLGVFCQGKSLEQLLAMSLAVLKGYRLPKDLPSEATLNETQWQLRFV